MKTNRLIPKRYLVAASLMLAGVVLTSYAGGNARRGTTRSDIRMAGVAPAERDRDPDYLEKRRQFANRFFGTGPGGVSPSA